MPESLPAEWQAAMVEMIRGAAPADARWLTGSHSLSPRDQLGIYQRQYQLRIEGALMEDAPGLTGLLGPRGCCETPQLLVDYLADHPSTSWSLDHLGRHLASWLQARGAPQQQVEMARLDEQVQRSFFAAEGQTPRPEQLAALPALRLQPHVGLLRFTWDVHRWRSEHLADQQPGPLVQGDFTVVVYRLERRIRHIQMPPTAWRLLQLIEQGRGVEEALGQVIEEDLVKVEDLGAAVGDWFRLFTERGLVELA